METIIKIHEIQLKMAITDHQCYNTRLYFYYYRYIEGPIHTFFLFRAHHFLDVTYMYI